MSVALPLSFLFKIAGLSPKLLVDNGCLLLSLRFSFSISAAICLSALLKTTSSSLKSTILASMTALPRAIQNLSEIPAISVFMLKFAIYTARLVCEPKLLLYSFMCFSSPGPPFSIFCRFPSNREAHNQNKRHG